MRKEKQNQFKEVLDYLEKEMAEQMANQLVKVWKDPEAARFLFGEYSKSEFEWLWRHGSGDHLMPKDRSPTWHRQNKRKALLRTRKAAITLFHASYFNTAFEEREWLGAFPIDALMAIIYFTCLRGGQGYAYQLAKAINDGLNENLQKTTGGFLKAQVCPQFFFSEEKVIQKGSEFSRRVVELTKEKALKESEEEEPEQGNPRSDEP